MQPKNQTYNDLPAQPQRGWFKSVLAVLTKNRWLSASVALLVIAVSAWWVVTNVLNVVALVDGHKITKAEYNNMAPRLQKFYEYNDDQEALKDIHGSVLNYLVEDKIIHQEAERQGIKTDPAEVERQQREIVEYYGSEEKYRLTIDSLYGWTPELHRQAIERQILQEKLEPLVIAARNGQFIAVQHLPGGGVTTMTEAQYAQRAEKTAQKIKADVDKEGFEKVFARASDYGDPNNGTDPLLVSAQSYSWVRGQQGVDKEALDAIYNTEPGSAPVLAKTSTFYGIFKIDTASDGTANSWEDFVKDYPHKIYADRLGPWYKSIWNTFLAALAPARVNAAVACNSSRCHASKVYGKVRDAITNNPINNATVRVYAVGPGRNGTTSGLTHPSCLDQPNNPNCKCGPKDITKRTDNSGDYQFGRNDGTKCAVNCYWTFWKADYSKAGYESKKDVQLGDLGNGSETQRNTTLRPNPADVTVVAKATFANGQINNLDNTRIEAISGPVGGGNTTFNRSQSSGFSAVFEAPSDARNGTFVLDTTKGNKGWQGCTSGNQAIRRCGIDLNNGDSKTITVWFKEVVVDKVNCTTQQSSYQVGTIVTFKAEGTPTGKTYGWTGFGSGASSPPVIGNGSGYQNASVTYSSAGPKTATVNYGTASDSCNITITPPPTPDQDASLTVASMPITGVPISSSGGCFSYAAGTCGTTNWTMKRTNASLSTTLGAPSTYGGYTFSNWSGCDSTPSQTTCTVSVNAGFSKTVFAIYYIPPPPQPTGGTPDNNIDFSQNERNPVY